MSEPIYAEGPEDLYSREALREMSGLDAMRAILEGRAPAPPIGRTLNFRLAEVEKGRVVFEGEPGFDTYNPLGAVHGGWFGAVLDSCMACAVMTELPKGRGYTTLDYSITIIRALTMETGPVRAEGLALRVGRQMGAAEGKLRDAQGRLVASGVTTCLVFDL